MSKFRMAVLGDSVPWGQGLLNQHKYHTLIENELLKSYDVDKGVLAHSGATIGVGVTTWRTTDGEVPISYPTIIQQYESYSDSPESVDLVLVNGGINDIDIRTILNPLTDSSDLSDDIRQHCYADMLILLQLIGTKFTSANAKIVVTGYYPILSSQSEVIRILPLLGVLGIGMPSHIYQGPLFDKIISLSLQFWHESDQRLADAVAGANAKLGGSRFVFVPSPLQEANSVFGPAPWLFGIRFDLSPQDEVIELRHQSCDAFFTNPLDIASREQCYRASAGHPNVIGAQQIASSILKAMGITP